MPDGGRSLVIPLDDVASNPVFIGERSRPSCATSVAFVDRNTIACAHFAGKVLYTFRFDWEAGTYQRLGLVDTTYDGARCSTDLMTANGDGLVVTTNFFEGACTVYRYDGQSVRFLRDLAFRNGEVLHGVKFYTPTIVAATSRRTRAGVHFFDVETSQPVWTINTPGRSVQDVCFVSPGRLVMISTTNSPKMAPHDMWGSVFEVIDFDLGGRAQRVFEKVYPRAHLDSVVMDGEFLYLTNQYDNLVMVMNARSFEPCEPIGGFSFPHGIDVKHGMMAVTNYGRNTVEIRAGV